MTSLKNSFAAACFAMLPSLPVAAQEAANEMPVAADGHYLKCGPAYIYENLSAKAQAAMKAGHEYAEGMATFSATDESPEAIAKQDKVLVGGTWAIQTLTAPTDIVGMELHIEPFVDSKDLNPVAPTPNVLQIFTTAGFTDCRPSF